MGVSAAVTMIQECSSSAHAQTPTFTAVYQLSGWIKVWFILFSYLAWLKNKGVRIIEVLLYSHSQK